MKRINMRSIVSMVVGYVLFVRKKLEITHKARYFLGPRL